MQDRRIAIIDLGTNTFHLLVVSYRDKDHVVIEEKFKEFVKLGEGGISSGLIAPVPFERGIAALAKFRKIIDAKGIDTVLAFATSAVRSASNGPDFVAAARARAGIEVQVINGNEEASYIYQGVRHGVQLPRHENVLIVDIGGGSVEFIVANSQSAPLIRSLKLGAARMLDIVQPADPLRPQDIERIEQLYDAELRGLLAEIREFRGIRTLVGSSGTFESLGAMVAHAAAPLSQADRDALPNRLNGFRFDVRAFRKLHRKLIKTTRAERKAMPGLESPRVDMILMGTLLVNKLVDALGIEDIMVSDYALKEGILYSHIEQSHGPELPTRTQREAREAAIKNLAVKYESNVVHAEQVSRLAEQIFTDTASLHRFGPHERELLRYAALLHDIGHFVNHSGHHKHGQYIVMNSALPGFTNEELLLVGNIVRYHRKSVPSNEHFHFNLLYPEHKDIVRRLGGILRIADNLDRGKRGMVRELHISLHPGRVTIDVVPNQPDEPLDIELESARAQQQLFEQAFGCTVSINLG